MIIQQTNGARIRRRILLNSLILHEMMVGKCITKASNCTYLLTDKDIHLLFIEEKAQKDQVMTSTYIERERCITVI